MILSIGLVEKKLSEVEGRQKYIEIKLADDYTDDEYKINPTFTFTAKDDLYLKNDASAWATADDLDDRYGSTAGWTKLIDDGDEFEGEFTCGSPTPRKTLTPTTLPVPAVSP